MMQPSAPRRRSAKTPGSASSADAAGVRPPRPKSSPSVKSTAFEPVAFLSVLQGTNGQARASEHIGLIQGQRATIGRGDTCFIRVSDEKCSREHCLVFQNAGQWMLKDMGSRNGTLIDEKPVGAGWPLFDKTIFQLGDTRVQFFESPPPLDDFGPGGKAGTAPDIDAYDERQSFAVVDDETADRVLAGDSRLDSGLSQALRRSDSEMPIGTAEVIEQARRSRLTVPDGSVGEKDAAAVATLLRIGRKVGQAKSIRAACRHALLGLIAQTEAEFGAVLMLPSTSSKDRDPAKLSMVGFESAREEAYTRVSQSVSRLVFDRNVGVLFRDTAAEDELSKASSVEEMGLHSAICVPLRLQNRIAGLLHLYSRQIDRPLAEHDFHLTLAVADLLSGVFEQLSEVRRAEEKAERERRDADALKSELAERSIGEIVGKSPSVRSLREQIARVAPTEATVLVRGESGVGKELVGRAMHFSSRRASGPFVTMNCAALTESLLESELFGHEKGSFTGATGQKKGKFEQADTGTLMLDEVGEMSLEIQAKFLRVLEGHPFERVGGSDRIETDVRVVAATNRDLEEAVREGTFRKDLYFRLHVIVITIDPLRHRTADIPLLAQHFIGRFAPKCGREVTGLSGEAIERLQRYRWPGNIRELQNTIERAVVLSEGTLIEPGDIRFSTLDADLEDEFDAEGFAADDEAADADGPIGGDQPFREVTIEDLEREHILSTLEATDWNKTRAASILGIERSTLDRKLKRYGVSRPT